MLKRGNPGVEGKKRKKKRPEKGKKGLLRENKGFPGQGGKEKRSERHDREFPRKKRNSGERRLRSSWKREGKRMNPVLLEGSFEVRLRDIGGRGGFFWGKVRGGKKKKEKKKKEGKRLFPGSVLRKMAWESENPLTHNRGGEFSPKTSERGDSGSFFGSKGDRGKL